MRKLLTMKNVFFCLLAFSVAWGEVAAGQTPVQPVYVRPSKGKAITVFSAVTLDASTNSTSDVYDWSGYNNVQILLTVSAALNTCQFIPRVTVSGAPAVSGTYTATIIQDGASSYTPTNNLTAVNFSYFVSNLPPFIKFNVVDAAGAGVAACTFTLAIIPQPFAGTQFVSGSYPEGQVMPADDFYPVVIGGLDQGTGVINTADVNSSGALLVDISGGGTGGPVNLTQVASSSTGLANVGVAGAGTQRVVEATTIIATDPTEVSVASTAGGTLVHAANANHKSVIIQNDENIVVSCGQTSAVTATGPGNKLKACTADDDGTGGSVTYDSGADVYCIAASGTAQVNVQIISR